MLVVEELQSKIVMHCKAYEFQKRLVMGSLDNSVLNMHRVGDDVGVHSTSVWLSLPPPELNR